MSFLERYQNGECEQVWSELVALGDEINSTAYQTDALAVTDETMRRTRHNIELLYHRLLAIDYRFVEPERAFVPPPDDVEDKIVKLESLIGGLPLSLKAWFRHVGGINFCGSHPKLSSYPARQRFPEWKPHDNWENFPYLTDPLYFCDVDSAIEESEYPRLLIDKGELDANNVVWFTIVDYLLKAGYSGDNYVLDLPNIHADIPLKLEPHNTYFVDYLRQSLQWGGFLGFHLYSDERFAHWYKKPEDRAFDIPHDLLKELSKDFLPI